MRQKIFTLLFAIIASIGTGLAESEVFEDAQGVFYETLDANRVQVIGYNGNNKNITIPEVIQGGSPMSNYEVVSIGYEAFKDNQVIESIVIPARITEIPMDAFYNCKMLYKVVFAEGSKLEKIEDYAFYYCTGLIDIVIPTWYQTIDGNTEEFPHIGSQGKAFKDVPNIIYHGKRTAERDKYYGWGARNINGIVDGYFVFPSGNTAKDELIVCSTAAKGVIVIPESVKYIRSKGFENCSKIKSLVIPENITECGTYCFSGCTGLSSVVCKATTPPNVNHHEGFQPAFEGVNKGIPIYVPEESILTYQETDGWNQFTNFKALTQEMYSVILNVDEDFKGKIIGDGIYSVGSEISIKATPNNGYHFTKWNDGNTDNPRTIILIQDTTFTAEFDVNPKISYKFDVLRGYVSGVNMAEPNSEVTFTAISQYGYHFTQWSDGNTDNPRTIILTQDTTFSAEFDIDKYGKCGANFALTWQYDDHDMILTISGNGKLDDNYIFGLEAPTQAEKLVIAEGVTAIGQSAFSNYSTLKHISIPTSVATIYEKAFYNCTGLKEMYCYRERPCVAYSNTFDGIDKFDCTLHVLSPSVDMYKIATGWRDFQYSIATIDAENIEDPITGVETEPHDNNVVITWPTDVNAATYTIQITKDGVVFCTLIFNADGQLTGIAFIPSRDDRQAPVAVKTSNGGLRFTVTGLDSGTNYGYSVLVKNKTNETVASYEGEFTTTGEQPAPTAIDEIINDQMRKCENEKLLRDGHILILRGDKVYTVTGQEVK